MPSEQPLLNFGVKNSLRLVLFTGASGGHIMPALAMRRKFPSSVIVALKTRAAENILKEIRGVLYVRPLAPKRFRPAALADIIKLIFFVRSFSPDGIVCFGSYLNALGALCAKMNFLPLFFFEPNAVMGKGTAYLKHFADKIFTVFPPQTVLDGKKTRGVKFPVISARTLREKALNECGFDFDKPVLLVLGGSQGSRFINMLVTSILERLNFVQIVHVTGPRDYEEVRECYSRHASRHIVMPFCGTMPFFYSMATAAVSRSGAGTLAELSFYKIPSLLIPYPHAGGHQKQNAVEYAATGAAKVFDENRIDGELLLARLEKIVFDGFWKMKENIAKMRFADDGTDFAEKLSGEIKLK